VSISPTFYLELLLAQIPKAQKDTDDLTKVFCPFGICLQKNWALTCWDNYISYFTFQTASLAGVYFPDKSQIVNTKTGILGLN
jgi:hypothetical protein